MEDPPRKLRRRTSIIVGVVVGIAILSIILGVTLRPQSPSSSVSDNIFNVEGNVTSSSNSTVSSAAFTVEASFELLETVPHDSDAFTQGLELIRIKDPSSTTEAWLFSDAYYQSTGQYGSSSLRKVDLRTGEVQQLRPLERSYFGEGMTSFDNGNKLIQITWKAQTAFVYNTTSFDVLEVLSYTNTNGQGWGICHVDDRNIFYVTDGTNYLHTWDEKTFELLGKVPVIMRSEETASARPVDRLNELEWDFHSRTVLANVWKEDFIVRIDPSTGFVTHRYDLSSLYRPFDANVLNGIAITGVPNEIWVTGKYWPNMYRIRLTDQTV